MTKKQKFIEIIQKEIFDRDDIYSENYPEDWEDLVAYWDVFKGKEENEKPLFTDNGKLILKYMQEHISDMPMAKARDIGEGLFISSRTVSGAIRKLVTDGYVEKIGTDPVVYSLTETGKIVEII